MTENPAGIPADRDHDTTARGDAFAASSTVATEVRPGELDSPDRRGSAPDPWVFDNPEFVPVHPYGVSADPTDPYAATPPAAAAPAGPWDGGAYPPGTDVPRPRGGSPWLRRAGALGVVAAVALASGATGAVIADRGEPAATSTTVVSPVDLEGVAGTAEGLAAVAAAVQPSVVSIAVEAGGTGGSGSGVIIASDGTIVTNNHVIEAAANGGDITVKLNDGRTAPATIVGRDPSTDLAVIKTDGLSDLKPATLGTTESLRVGDTVLALGSPLGLEGSVTSGIVSALGRTVDIGPDASLYGAVQTDAAINPGNSGGALVDSQGRIVGINSAIATLGSGGGQSGSIGLGFAIPVDEARTVTDALIKGETPTRAVLGVQITDATSSGALIDAVTPGSGAAEAGLQAGDVVTEFGDTTIASGTDLSAAVRTSDAGDEVPVTYTRNGETRTTTVTLGSSTD